jgi:hypothetical protein
MTGEDNRRSFFPSYSEFRSNNSIDIFSKHPSPKSKTASWTQNLWDDYFKINSKIGGLWGIDIPGPLEGKKASRKALGPLLRKAIPSWARGGMSGRMDRHEIGSTRTRAAH